MTASCSWRIVAEKTLLEHRVQLVEDDRGGYHLRKVSKDDGAILSIAAVHSDASVLAEARELFPDFLPFGGLPVDAT
jgi:hypothetical protein